MYQKIPLTQSTPYQNATCLHTSDSGGSNEIIILFVLEKKKKVGNMIQTMIQTFVTTRPCEM